MRRGLTLAVALAGLGGCGPDAAVWLRVEAPLQVPEECDTLEVKVHRGAADGPLSFEGRYPLGTDQSFPATLSLRNDSQENLTQTLTISVRALKGEALAAPWSSAEATAQLRAREWTPVSVALCDCPSGS